MGYFLGGKSHLSRPSGVKYHDEPGRFGWAIASSVREDQVRERLEVVHSHC
jgi:hypothetical protein